MLHFIFIFLACFNTNTIHVFHDLELEAIIIEGLSITDPEGDFGISIYFGKTTSHPIIPKVIGNFSLKNSKIIFKPKYGWSTGVSYTVIIETPNKIRTKYSVVIPEVKFESSTIVKSVYPSASKLPMNQLKLYIEFSAPMRTGDAYEYLSLYKIPEGKLESEAFLVSTDELWDLDKKRLTVYFDPGRIKRGIEPNLQLGLPLVEGHWYKLKIDKTWLDINGAQLMEGYEKVFEVIVVDRTVPNKNEWKISFPKLKSMEPIIIDFKESMDYGLLQNSLTILDKNNTPIKGKVQLYNYESVWKFIPEMNWAEGNYKIVIDAWLEDLAGNSLRRKMDRNLNDPKDNPNNINEVIIPFEIK